jgi:hypothetical protein
MGNPFDGSNTVPIRYVPQRYVDPITRIIHELDPSGYGWFEVGVQVPMGTTPPPPTYIPPIRNDISDDSVKSNSAVSFAQSMRIYNNNLYKRYVDAYAAWASGKGSKTEPARPAYGIDNWAELYYEYALKNKPMPIPPEVNYNQ